ncbi:enoyl-CoA hydratase/isomerase domain-containing protein [Heterostelium album PN500]|uniref:Enoyl-CoA hydratase/isomerase domain-containing protein n=1 Tax=Heterostelium pallidum (strain ATCC 26659 / Pp 5 / PN500) TaxID=670386 RepID=D3AYB9_HETP5|nr:enoyl-CoA hydratase/isomerase domain-containing protein [Heterostelium album PN500]EFA85946.1 enoyl-CoA hydratase/isomerase domain-containing protein [Heterostelium album PN500]|eukprot:XP_020438052.1 enoyl-CoA hydratase/isomerase domain-containing protein [Heterostelium album PN500]
MTTIMEKSIKRINVIGEHIISVASVSQQQQSTLKSKMNQQQQQSNENDSVLLEKHENNTTVITLNRLKQLNVLNTHIFVNLNKKLLNYANNDNAHLLVLKGAGEKAYCAGGDIKELTSQTRKLGYSFPKYFFTHEYNMDYTAATLKKPTVVFWDGISMGGGLGVSIHSTFRIVTERTVWAMPEVSIGLFPDVGGSYFLARLPDSLGNYLGITGKSISGADCLKFGIATHYVESSKLPELERKLITLVNSQDRNKIEAIINEFASQPKQPSKLLQDWPLIQQCFANRFNNVQEILDALEASKTKWGSDLVKLIRTKSPTSVKIAFRQVKEGNRSLEEIFTMEYRIAIRCLESPDFFEGITTHVDHDDEEHCKYCRRKTTSIPLNYVNFADSNSLSLQLQSNSNEICKNIVTQKKTTSNLFKEFINNHLWMGDRINQYEHLFYLAKLKTKNSKVNFHSNQQSLQLQSS